MIIVHLVLMFLALCFALSAVYMIIKKPKGWFKLHKFLGISALISALLAFGMIFFFKYTNHYPHFKSDHAEGGAITLLLLIFTITFGIMANKGNKLSRKIHILLGSLTALLMLIAAAFGIDRFIDLTKK